MACAPDAPRNTASRFIGWMARWFESNEPQVEKLISYQDTHVHTGTIYRAAGWDAEWTTVPRIRDRSTIRNRTGRLYRTNINGIDADASPKIRWAYRLKVNT